MLTLQIYHGVGNNDSNISGMKSHDSHVMMQCLLPVVMRGYLGGDVQTTLIELRVFFRDYVVEN